jgi:hypothetical protein
VVFLVEAGAKDTAKLAKSCKIEEKSGTKVLHLKLAGGKEVEVSLL